MEHRKKPSPGRPRSFDRDQVLETAMRLFWRHGYEGVSLQQLTAASGLAPPSLYAAFGNKEALYLAALDRYAAMRDPSDLAFIDECDSLGEAVRVLLEATARGVVDPTGEAGCMLNMGMITSHPDNEPLREKLAARRAAFRRRLQKKLARWTAPDRAAIVARHVSAVMQGMAIQARDGATAKELLALADEVARGAERLAAPIPA